MKWIVLLALVFLVFISGCNTPTSFEQALELAVKNNNPETCNTISEPRFYDDYSISLQESIDLCKSEFAIETENLSYCMTLKEKPTYVGSISQRDVCLKGLAKKLNRLDLCDLLYSGQDEKYGETYIETCKTLVASTVTTVDSPLEYKPSQVLLTVGAPFSDAEINIEKLVGKNGAILTYVASSPDTGIDEQNESFEISQQKFNQLTELIEKNNFQSFKESYIEENLEDATTYTVSVKYIPTGLGAEFADAFVHTVSCYGQCPVEIVEIRNKIKELRGKEILEVGV